jgi:hypothetical protein
MTAAAGGRARWLRLAVATLFFGWLYGTPLLLGMALLHRTYAWPEAELAAAYTRTTRYFVGGIALAVGAPVLGLAVSAPLRWRDWTIRFVAALACSFAALLVLSDVASSAHAPLFGRHVEPSPSPPGCAIHSGGSNTCPGG